MGQMIQFPANGHSTAGYLASPSPGQGPGLLVLPEWCGLVDHIKDLCDRYAAQGFVALAPDLYHGVATKSPDEAGKLFMALNIAKAAADLRGAADFLLARPEVTSKKIEAAGGTIEAHFYPADHAFFNHTRPTVFDKAAAELAWKRTLDFLWRHLAWADSHQPSALS